MIYRELITEARRVYVNADASGKTSDITVSDQLSGVGNGAVSDSSDLKDIQNTGSAEAILDLLSGKESLSKILMEDRISVEGYYDKVERLNDIKLQKESR